ncbi:MAG: ROK family protein [Agriterribacter sp.]
MLLGFDIGGTKCAIVLSESYGEGYLHISEKRVFATNKPVYEMIELLFSEAEALLTLHKCDKSQLMGIGISCGGPLSSKRGVILSPPNLPGWDNVPIVNMCEKRFGTKTILQNDANACAVAEWKFGAGKGLSDVIFLTFGTGMGSGIIINGKLHSGVSDLAGEVGHLRLSDMGPVGFGKAGSFEGWCSGSGIAQLAQVMAREKLQMGEKTAFCAGLNELDNITARSVAEAAMAGDPTAIAVYEHCATYLGKALALLIDILNPQMIIMGSIFERSKSLLEPVMHEILKKEALQQSYKDCKIVPAALGEQIGDMAALSLAYMSSKE